jgi:hypothetical protein
MPIRQACRSLRQYGISAVTKSCRLGYPQAYPPRTPVPYAVLMEDPHSRLLNEILLPLPNGSESKGGPPAGVARPWSLPRSLSGHPAPPVQCRQSVIVLSFAVAARLPSDRQQPDPTDLERMRPVVSDATLVSFAASLPPPAYDRTEVGNRRVTIEKALRASSLAVTSMFESGSWSHGTGVKAHSDVDYMAVATGARPVYPSSALEAAKRALTGCDWKINSLRVSSPVVAVGYYSPPDFEVAPAWYYGGVKGFNVYYIGGRGDEWVYSAPSAHLAYVNAQNDRLNKGVKPLVRLLKAWKYNVGAPISSFYLEMRTTEHASGESSIVLDIDLRSVFGTIIRFEARNMNDPLGIVGTIPACSSTAKRQESLTLATQALSHLYVADSAKDRGDAAKYWTEMSAVFGRGYPWPSW